MSVVRVACLVVLAVAATFPVVEAWRVIPKFVVDLAKDPQRRWDGAVDLVLSQHSFNSSFGEFFFSFQSQLEALSDTQKAAIVESVKVNFPTNFQEVSGIAQQFQGVPDAQIVTPEFLALWMWFHELGHAPGMLGAKECTGIIVLPNSTNAPVFHARNLDQEFNSARNATLHVQFKNTKTHGDQVLFEGADFYWTTSGLVTMQQTNGFTFQENWMLETVPLADIIDRIVKKRAVPQVLQFREFLLQQVDSKSADPLQDVLSFFNDKSTFAAGQYVIFSTFARNGGVLSLSFTPSKNRMDILSAKFADQQTPPESSGEGVWFLVQTNYNRSLPDPSYDPRRTVAINALDSLGREVGASSVGAWLALTQEGVSVSSTEYSCLMSASPVAGTPPLSCVIRDNLF